MSGVAQWMISPEGTMLERGQMFLTAPNFVSLLLFKDQQRSGQFLVFSKSIDPTMVKIVGFASTSTLLVAEINRRCTATLAKMRFCFSSPWFYRWLEFGSETGDAKVGEISLSLLHSNGKQENGCKSSQVPDADACVCFAKEMVNPMRGILSEMTDSV
ncbi:hypothetical protein ACFX12_044292 [Malus domestica]